MGEIIKNNPKTALIGIRELLSICLVWIFTIAFFFSFISAVLNIPLFLVLSAFFKSFGYGQFPQIPHSFLGQNVFITFYVILFVQICFLTATTLLQRFTNLRLYLPRLSKAISISAIILFLVLMSIRQFKLNQLISNTLTQFSKITPDEYYTNHHFISYPFAKFCKSKLNGRYVGLYITDLDLTSYEMFFHRQLRYHLYPNVYIHTSVDNPDVLIVHMKNNPEAVVPKDFKIIGKFNDLSLIAIKNDLIQ